jgi:RND family efflux transporter MFP subunit
MALTACSDNSKMVAKDTIRPVKLFTISAKDSSRFRTFPAKVVSSESTELSFRIPGELIALPVKEGQEVSLGEVIARLDDSDLRNQLRQAQAHYELAKAEFERKKNLYSENIISKSSLDQAETALTAAEVGLKLAKDNLQHASITAPFSGRIGRVFVENHQFVQAKQPIVLLQTIDTLDIQLELPESIVANIRQDAKGSGYQPEVRFQSATDQVFYARYKEHATEPTPGTQSYRVTLTMNKPKTLTVLPGMTASVTIDLQAITHLVDDAQLVVPLTAVMKDDASGQSLIWKFDSQTQRVQPIEVTLGELTERGIQVKAEGLTSGDKIVVAGIYELTPGQKVKELKKPRGL